MSDTSRDLQHVTRLQNHLPATLRVDWPILEQHPVHETHNMASVTHEVGFRHAYHVQADGVQLGV